MQTPANAPTASADPGANLLPSVAGLLVALMGGAMVVTGLQLLIFVAVTGGWALASCAVVAAGAAAVLCGIQLFDGRGWAAWVGLGLAIGTFTGMPVFVVLAFLSGFISLAPVVASGLSVLALVAVPLALPGIRRAEDARALLSRSRRFGAMGA